ncbi:MAG: DedA family protein [Xanthomonadales bacterium]|nr:DedA family protein [Xanthomonadales bacterium]
MTESALQLPAFVATLLAMGVLGLALIALIEKLVPIIPSYVLYVFLGIEVVHDTPDLFSAIVATTAGGMLAGLLWYGLGRALGPRRTQRLVQRYGRYLLIPQDLFAKSRRGYRKQPLTISVIGHSIPVVRFFIPLPAGMMAVPLLPFLIGGTLGCLLWNSLLIGIGYGFAEHSAHPVMLGVTAVFVLLALEFALFALWRRRQQRLTTA